MGSGTLRDYVEGNAYLLRRLSECDAEIADLRKRVNEAGQMVAAGEAERKALTAQVAELQAWKDAVPVVGIKRLFRDAPYDASYADEVWQWIEKYTLNR